MFKYLEAFNALGLCFSVKQGRKYYKLPGGAHGDFQCGTTHVNDYNVGGREEKEYDGRVWRERTMMTGEGIWEEVARNGART